MKNLVYTISIMGLLLLTVPPIIAQETQSITVYANGPYEVWGGSTDYENYYGCKDPEDCGYNFLGSAENTNTFSSDGNQLYYIITTNSDVAVDAIDFPNGYFSTYLRMGNAHCKDFEYDTSENLIGNIEDYSCESNEVYIKLTGSPDGNYINFGLPSGWWCSAGPYMGGIIVFDSFVGDSERDGDIDGSDLAAYIAGEIEFTLNVIAENFGKSV